MEFVLVHKRAVMGNDIKVTVTAGDGQTIRRVATEYDSSQLGDDTLDPPSAQYARFWKKKGLAGPGQQHTLRVVATDGQGIQENAVEKWEDDS